MKIHCIGPGSIGSLLCFHLQSISPITLLLRSRQAQHRRVTPNLSIQIENDHLTRTRTGFTYEFLDRQQQQPIESLIVTTKAPHVLESVQRVRHRLSSTSTVLLLHNGLGVIEELLDTCFQEPNSRPSFILATTSHGVYRIDRGTETPQVSSHGRFCHAGLGDILLGVLPNNIVKNHLENFATQQDIEGENNLYDNPILNPLSKVKPVLSKHLPDIHPETKSLHHTLSSLLNPVVATKLNTKLLAMSSFQTSALIKLTVNAVINPISALLETRNEALYHNSTFDSLSHQICQEASSVFSAQSGEPLRPHHPLSVGNLRRVVGDIVSATRANISSMCTDIRTLAANRISPPNTLSNSNLNRLAESQAPIKISNIESLVRAEEQKSVKETSTEIDYINGYICRLGQQYGIQTPVNECLLNLIKLKSLAIKSCKVLPKLQRVNRKFTIIKNSTSSRNQSSSQDLQPSSSNLQSNSDDQNHST